ncbi:MAG: ATP-binding protein, partial [Bacteroidota bacterium]
MSFAKRFIANGTHITTNETEIKRIKVLNLTAGIALFHAVFFLIFDFITDTNSTEKLIALTLEMLFFLLIIWFQSKGWFKVARLSFMIVVFLLLLYHCNVAFKGYYGEYQYFVIPLFSLFLFDKYYLHYSLLVLSIAAFYVPNWYLNIYPEQYFGYLNALLLFVGIFLIMDFFKRNSEHNERALEQQLKENLSLQKTLDEQNKQLQSLNAFQNHFFVNIAHEMNTPVTLLKGQTHRLLKESNNSSFHETAGKIQVQVHKLEVLTTGIMDIAKIDSETLVLNKKVVSINQLVQSAYLEFQPIYEKKSVTLDLSLHEHDGYAKVDALYLERVLGNLLSNAFKFSSSGDRVKLGVTTENDRVSITVSDNAIGVPEEDLELIFERFYQSPNEINKSNGSGIGLSFAKEIIELHYGSIKACNNPRGGLTVQITLKGEEHPADSLSNPEETTKLQSLLGKKILVVDDNLEMREYLVDVLNEYHTITAENGVQALELIGKEKIDAIITDYMMPIMDGKQLVTELKKNQTRIPIVVITARADMGSKLDMLTLGVDDYLNKPFVEDELLLRLKNILTNDIERNLEIPEENEGETKTFKADTLTRCIQLVESNISNSYYGVAQLSEDLKISERTLYRAIKKETGLTPNQFIREMKLSEVRQQVELGNVTTLNDLALSVGLTNGTYLNQLYKERFGTLIEFSRV